jgi:acyl-CoA-binding protein
MDIDQEFLKAQAESKDLPERPDNATLLKLYALFKQGSSGDASGERPGATDFVARAKYDAWLQLAGTSAEDAKRQYINLIEDLKDA